MSKIKTSISFGIVTLALMAHVGLGFSQTIHSSSPLQLDTPPPEKCENGTCPQNTSTSPCGPRGCGGGGGGGLFRNAAGGGGGLFKNALGGRIGQGLGGGLGQGLGGMLGQGLGGIMQKLFSGLNPQMIMQMLTGLMMGKN